MDVSGRKVKMKNKSKNNKMEYKNIITISELTKKFGRKIVLSNVSFQINRGDSIAFVGHNGCGKSTILKIIAGILPFEKGKVTHNRKLKFGYVPERFPVMSLTVRDYIHQIGSIEGLRKESVDKRSMELFEALFMRDMVETPICYLSKGTIQKVAVIQALLTTPDILILDEPVSGQDMASQRVFIEMVNSLNREHGVTILSSLHENYMIKAITKSVYEIIEGKLHTIEQTTKSDIDNLYRLLFAYKSVNGKNEKFTIPQTVIDTSVKLEQLEGQEIAVYVTISNSDWVIREMLNNDFELRGLNNERIS